MSVKAPIDIMPLPEGEELTQWINRHAQRKGDQCPHCGSLDSSVQPQIVTLAAPNPHKADNTINAPFGAVVCHNCGLLRLFNLIISGVLLPPDEPNPAGA